MNRRLIPILVACLAALAGRATAQEQDVARGSYPFFQRTLTIAVNARVPGELQIVRSRAARVDVAALASPGVASFVLGGQRGDELRLTAAGAERAVFIVTVPERVYVSVQAPGTNRSFGAFRPVQTVEWGGVDEERPEPAPPMLPGRDGYFHVYGAAQAPGTVSLPSLEAVRRLDVRIEGDAFALAASRALTVRSGNRDALVVDVDDNTVDLVLTIPAGTRAFRIRAAGQTVLVVRNSSVASHCNPAVVQSLSDGRARVLLTPTDSRLVCPA